MRFSYPLAMLISLAVTLPVLAASNDYNPPLVPAPGQPEPLAPAPVTECDRLVANFYDPYRVSQAIPRLQVSQTGVDACERAFEEFPNDPRIQAYYGYAIINSGIGDYQFAYEVLERSMLQGYPMAPALLWTKFRPSYRFDPTRREAANLQRLTPLRIRALELESVPTILELHSDYRNFYCETQDEIDERYENVQFENHYAYLDAMLAIRNWIFLGPEENLRSRLYLQAMCADEGSLARLNLLNGCMELGFGLCYEQFAVELLEHGEDYRTQGIDPDTELMGGLNTLSFEYEPFEKGYHHGRIIYLMGEQLEVRWRDLAEGGVVAETALRILMEAEASNDIQAAHYLDDMRSQGLLPK